MERTITALEVQKRNTDRVSVFLDGEFAFGLPAIDAAKLHKGQVLAESEVTALREIDAISRAFDRAVRLLARRPYSTFEIRRKLASKQIAQPVIDEVLARLERLEYVDDRAFAEYWIDNRERFRPRGPRALRYELRKKGIPQNIIDSVLQDVDSLPLARRAAQKRVRRLRGMTRHAWREKMSAYLSRRGFDYHIVRDVTDQMISEFENEQPDYFVPDQTEE